ncbi:MAG: glycosyltransferase [Lachnospiraceae bacterium]|nr:glycosyltransferase [Lachnospiraceae bacterium]
MKHLTITVPCFNSEQYLERCVDSLVIGGKDVEIIIVNDGSTDRTGEIAERYARQFPDIVTVVHKENGGHGSGVNAGLALASGMYFKVVDSDDWLEKDAYLALLKKIEGWCEQGFGSDLLICDYTYNHLEEGTEKTIHFKNVFPVDKVCTWEHIGAFRPSQYLVMHALVYRTDILRKSRIVLPEHTFYVDNLFAYCPLPYVETLYYMNINLYQYYLGREDQSVNEKVLTARIEQQIKVTKMVAESVDLNQVKRKYPKLANYMCRNISIMMAISSIHLLLRGDEKARTRHYELWSDIKRSNPKLYYRLRYTKLSGFTNLPGKLGKLATVGGYRLARKIYQFQ